MTAAGLGASLTLPRSFLTRTLQGGYYFEIHFKREETAENWHVEGCFRSYVSQGVWTLQRSDNQSRPDRKSFLAVRSRFASPGLDSGSFRPRGGGGVLERKWSGFLARRIPHSGCWLDVWVGFTATAALGCVISQEMEMKLRGLGRI